MRSLTVLFDPGCTLCRAARAWLEGQKKYVSLEFVGAGTAEARRRFPDLDPASTLKEITVVDDGCASTVAEKSVADVPLGPAQVPARPPCAGAGRSACLMPGASWPGCLATAACSR